MSEEEANMCTRKCVPEERARALEANCSAYRAGITEGEVVEYYSTWAVDDKYEQDLCLEHYKGPVSAANAVAEFCCDSIPQTKVLDVAAGTGFVGEQLQKRGFKHIDALDPAARMLEQARKKNIYTNLYCEFLDGKRLPIEDDTYNCCVISGGMGEGHIPCCGLNELIRLTKPGGFVCIVMMEEQLSQCREYKYRLEPLMKELEDAGKWEKLSRDILPKYAFDKNGVIFRFRIC